MACISQEFLNEPAWKVEWDHGRLLEYYSQAYGVVRKASASALAVFNVLYSAEFPAGFGNCTSLQALEPRGRVLMVFVSSRACVELWCWRP